MSYGWVLSWRFKVRSGTYRTHIKHAPSALQTSARACASPHPDLRRLILTREFAQLAARPKDKLGYPGEYGNWRPKRKFRDSKSFFQSVWWLRSEEGVREIRISRVVHAEPADGKHAEVVRIGTAGRVIEERKAA
jgi:hypothetical protein